MLDKLKPLLNILQAFCAIDQEHLVPILVPPELCLRLTKALARSLLPSLLQRMNLSIVPLLVYKFRHIQVVDHDGAAFERASHHSQLLNYFLTLYRSVVGSEIVDYYNKI